MTVRKRCVYCGAAEDGVIRLVELGPGRWRCVAQASCHKRRRISRKQGRKAE